MRRITLNPTISKPLSSINDFDMKQFYEDRIIIKTENGTFNELSAKKREFNPKRYSAPQLAALDAVNNVLETNNEPLLTDEEAEAVLYPFGREQEVKPEEIQALAGFKVEKKITAV